MKTVNKNLNGICKNKTKFGIILLIFIFNLLAVNAAASDGMMCGTLSDLEKIFATNATTPQDGPPVDYIISKANYNGVVVDDYAEMNAVYDIEVLKDDWVKIKLVSGGYVALKNVRLNGADVSLITEDNKNYILLKNKGGKHKLEINFLVKINEGNFGANSRDMKLVDFPETPISTLKIEIPKTDIGIEIEPSFSTEIKEYQNKTVATATLVPGGISVIWYSKREEIIKEKLPAKVYADVNSLVSIGEGVMKCYSVIDYSIAQGSTSQFRVQIPTGVSVLEVTDFYGKPLREYKIEDNILLIQTPYDVADNYKIDLRYEKDMVGTSAVSNVPEIKVLDVERETGYFGIEARTNVEINIVESSSAARIDVNELPQGIWDRSKTPLLFGYKYLKHPYSVTLDVKKHEDLPVLVAAIDYAKIMTLLTEDGKSITKATYYIKNNRKQFLEVSLPKNSEIWSAFVSGAPVKPAENEEGKILIPLSRSSGYEGSIYAFPVEFVYITNISGFGNFGSSNYEIPSVDIPASQVDLLLYLPEDYDFIKFEGDMKEIDYSAGYNAVDEGGVQRPTASPAPQVSNVADEEMEREESATIGAKTGAKIGAKIQQDNAATAFQDELQEATEKGILPVRINIPENGKAYRFTKLLAVENKKLKVNATYLNSGVYTWIGRIVLLFILALGFYVVRGLKNLRGQLIKISLIIIVPLIISYFLSGVWNYANLGWVLVLIGAVIYGLYIFMKGYVGIRKKVRREKAKVEEKK